MEYDPGWPREFERLSNRLDAALVGVAHVTEHVGSTAVPGLAAKPIIDVDIVVTDAGRRGPSGQGAAAAGGSQGDLAINAGKRSCHRPTPPITICFFVAASQPHRDHVDLRDFLRAHPDHAARDAALKRRLAVLLETDRAAYVRGKEDMITEFLHMARSEGPSDAEPDTASLSSTDEPGHDGNALASAQSSTSSGSGSGCVAAISAAARRMRSGSAASGFPSISAAAIAISARSGRASGYCA